MPQSKGILSRVYTALILLFLYAPLLVMVLFSFNSGHSTAVFEGFTLHWYQELARNLDAQKVLKNTMLLAFAAAVVSVVLGTLAATGIDRVRRKWAKGLLLSVTNLPLMNPEIVTGVSMMLLFVFAQQLLNRFFGLEVRTLLGFGSLLAAHITFCLPYVILSVLPKLRQTDPHLAEAAQDLGCSPVLAFFKVVLPSISTGVFSAFLMAFTISLDDFVVSNFTSGSEFQTLPLYIYAMTKRKVRPDMYSLSSLVFFAIFALLILSNVLQARAEKRAAKQK
ncbi:MAG: ABC transporter permease [Oscillospiraceae bacterium]|jgi:spermidine/putrescine transport system permease protein|nr:ABC transporter permease [Oscillospiraceae bacterium]